jgi:hypothetical protein
MSLGPRHRIGFRKMKPEHGRTIFVVNLSVISALLFDIEAGGMTIAAIKRVPFGSLPSSMKLARHRRKLGAVPMTVLIF